MTQRFKIELCRPVGAGAAGIIPLLRAAPLQRKGRIVGGGGIFFCLYGSRAHIRHAFPCVLYWCGLETAPSLKPHLLLTKEGGTTCGRPAGDPRKDVPIREAGKCTGVPVYQRTSTFLKHIRVCARGCIYGNCRYAGTLVHFAYPS